MKSTWFILAIFINSYCHAVLYDSFEIKNILNDVQLKNSLNTYSQRYFTSTKPNLVIDELISAKILPLQRESILFNLLTEISQQPPQDYHQYFVDLMKAYPVEATRTALEDHLPAAIFNLNSKAHGIENIWTAYRTERQFNQLFSKDHKQAVIYINAIIDEDSSQRRPKWLGIKNSIAAMQTTQLTDLADYLRFKIKANSGLDQLISHVGLVTGNTELINKALHSEQSSVRQYTLRKLAQHLPQDLSKDILLSAATGGQDVKFSTSLLGEYLADTAVQDFMLTQLSNKITADTAAFVFSQADMNESSYSGLAEQLKNQFMRSDNDVEKNHIILALKLNPANSAQLALNDIKKHINTDSNAKQWLNSFDKQSGGQQ